jgi:hypothetical protein
MNVMPSANHSVTQELNYPLIQLHDPLKAEDDEVQPVGKGEP